jgi:hypothetical protein
MSGPPLPTIPGETAKDYRARLKAWREQDVARCACGCKFVIAELRREIKRLKRK